MKFLVNALQGRELRSEVSYMHFDIVQEQGIALKILTGAKKYFGSVNSRLMYGRKRINRYVEWRNSQIKTCLTREHDYVV